MTTEVLSLLEQHATVERQIAEMFGLDYLWHNLVDCTDENWIQGGIHDDVTYGFEDNQSYEDGECYSFEIYGTSHWVSKCEKYSLFVGDDGSGGRDMYIFSSDKEWTD